MVVAPPKFLKGDMYQLLRVDNVKAFNIKKEAGKIPELVGTDLRGLDLRGLDADGLDLTDCYLRDTDLRGVDLSNCCMEGCSIRGAKISGTRFPVELNAEEIRLSHDVGIRMRYSK